MRHLQKTISVKPIGIGNGSARMEVARLRTPRRTPRRQGGVVFGGARGRLLLGQNYQEYDTPGHGYFESPTAGRAFTKRADDRRK